MKQLIPALIAAACFLPLTCQAKGDSLGINKDCDSHPVSQYGMDSISAFNQYNAEPKKFMDAMTAFCNKGKTMGDMGFEAADRLSLSESKKWADSNLPVQSEEQKKFSSNIGYLLYYAMLNGFSGFDYPKPPEQNTTPSYSFKPNETCDTISSKAAERSVSQFPPQVQISLAEWKQIKGEFEMVCLTGIMNGNSRKPADNRLIGGFNDIARDVFYQAYQIGSKYPQYKASGANNEAAMKEKERKADAAAKKAASEKEQARAKSNIGVDDLFGDLSSGKNAVKKTNAESSSDVGKQRSINRESEEFQLSLRNSFMQRIGNSEQFAGKKCSVNIWFSQSGDILSIREKFGDAELCSAILKSAKGLKFKPMSDEVYKIHRNTPVDFNL